MTHLIVVQALGPRDGGAASGGVSGPGMVLVCEYDPCSTGLAPECCNCVMGMDLGHVFGESGDSLNYGSRMHPCLFVSEEQCCFCSWPGCFCSWRQAVASLGLSSGSLAEMCEQQK